MDAKCIEHGCYWKAENEHLKKCLLENFDAATAEVNALRAALEWITEHHTDMHGCLTKAREALVINDHD